VLIDSAGQLGTMNSSRRFKWDIKDMGDASAGLMSLRPVRFRYKQGYADGSYPVQYGLIAEEVAKVYPDLVVRSADGQIETVQYYKLDAMLLNELQKLHGREQDLEALVGEQQERLSRQERDLESLRAQLGALLRMLERRPEVAPDAAPGTGVAPGD
jgi:hypothetical protein